jgi:hypothetical protein
MSRRRRTVPYKPSVPCWDGRRRAAVLQDLVIIAVRIVVFVCLAGMAAVLVGSGYSAAMVAGLIAVVVSASATAAHRLTHASSARIISG